MTDPLSACILPLTPDFADRAGEIAARLSLPLVESEPDVEMLVLEVSAQLTLRPAALADKRGRRKASAGISVDFVSGKAAHRRQFGGGRGQPLARALGLKSGRSPSIIDATAGLGRDAFVLATLGCRVQMIEREPLLAELLADGLRRGLADSETAEICQRLALLNANAADWMRQLDASDAPDCIYLDPMYPHRDKAAAVKKEMQIVQQIAGPDLDSAELLAAALDCARARVVVKRPKGAPTLEGPAPSAAVSGPNTRYDLYVLRALDGD
jgi:16S rRNA (guanine1516-N2)-methyltransferase